MLSHDAPLDELLTADAVTITFENQKNGHKGAVLHHTATDHATFDPVVAMAHRLHALRHLPPSTPLSTYIAKNQRKHVLPTMIRQMLHISVVATGLLSSGYTLDRIGTHSLRASGAMALKLNGHDKATIQKLGRWSSDTYLRYIHAQIGELSQGLASSMATPLHFTNLAV
jgi:hypothetical protein